MQVIPLWREKSKASKMGRVMFHTSYFLFPKYYFCGMILSYCYEMIHWVTKDFLQKKGIE